MVAGSEPRGVGNGLLRGSVQSLDTPSIRTLAIQTPATARVGMKTPPNALLRGSVQSSDTPSVRTLAMDPHVRPRL